MKRPRGESGRGLEQWEKFERYLFGIRRNQPPYRVEEARHVRLIYVECTAALRVKH